MEGGGDEGIEGGREGGRVERKKGGTKRSVMGFCFHVQAVRNDADLLCMAAPRKYLQMNTFYKVGSLLRVSLLPRNHMLYTPPPPPPPPPPPHTHTHTHIQYYSGEKVAPVLTLFIGGNHEASNHLWEL